MYNKNLILLIFTVNSICMFKNTSARRSSMSCTEKDDEGNVIEQHEMYIVAASSKEQSISIIPEPINQNVEKNEIENAEKAASVHVKYCLPEFKPSSNYRRNSQSFLSAASTFSFATQPREEVVNESQAIEESEKRERKERVYRFIEDKHGESSDADKTSRLVSMFTSQNVEFLSFEFKANGIVKVLECQEGVSEASVAKAAQAKSLKERNQSESDIVSHVLHDKNKQSNFELPALSSFNPNSNDDVDDGDISNACLLDTDCIKDTANNLKTDKLDKSKSQVKDNKISTLFITENECFATIESGIRFHFNGNIAASQPANKPLSALSVTIKEEAAIGIISKTNQKNEATMSIIENKANSGITNPVSDDMNSETITAKAAATLTQNKTKCSLFILSLFLFAASISSLVYKICKNSGFKYLFSLKTNIFISLLTFSFFISLIVLF